MAAWGTILQWLASQRASHPSLNASMRGNRAAPQIPVRPMGSCWTRGHLGDTRALGRMWSGPGTVMWRKASKSTPVSSNRGSGTRLQFTQKPAALFGLPREGPVGVSGRGHGCASYGWGWSRSRGADKEPASKQAGGRAGGPDTEGRKGLRAFQSPRVGPGGEAGGQFRRPGLADPAAAQRGAATQENKGEEPDAGAALVPARHFLLGGNQSDAGPAEPTT